MIGRLGRIVAGCVLLAGCVPPPQANYGQLPPGNEPPPVAQPAKNVPPPGNAAPQAQVAQQTQQKFTIAADLLFSHGGIDLTAKGQAVLNDIATRLQTVKNSWVAVYAYTDDEQVSPGLGVRGINSNVDFSSRRAEAVEAYLLRRGINPDHLSFKGRGEAEPVARNDTAAGRAQNRRIEIIVEGAGPV